MVDLLKTVKPKLTYNQYVKLVDGFYKGYKGTIKDFRVEKHLVFYDVDVEIEQELKTMTVEEKFLKVAYKGSLSKIFG